MQSLRPGLVVLAALLAATSIQAQTSAAPKDARPLPDITGLMHEVEQHQRDSEKIQKDYLYHELATQQEDNGKKTETREFDVFWLNGVEVQKLTRKNGKELSPEEQKKENDRIDKEVAKARARKAK